MILLLGCEDTRRASRRGERERDREEYEFEFVDPPQPRTAYARCVGAGCMPDLRLVEPDGTVHSRDALSGKVVLLVSWAPWCTPCLDVIAALSRIEQRSAGRDLVVLGMNLEVLDRRQMDSARLDIGMSFPSAGFDVAAFGAPGNLPTTWLYDRHGSEVRKFDGALDEAALLAEVERLLEP